MHNIGIESDRESFSRVKCYENEKTASFRAGIWPGFTESSSLLVLVQRCTNLRKSGTYRLDSTGRKGWIFHHLYALLGFMRNRVILRLDKTGFGQQGIHLLKA